MSSNPYKEEYLYPQVCRWLEERLASEFPRCRVVAKDTHRTSLRLVIPRLGLSAQLPEYPVWDFKVDVAAFIVSADDARVVFVECKKGMASLQDLSQLLGYSRVAMPFLSFLVSPNGPSDILRDLIVGFGRGDVLEYAPNQSIAILTWDVRRGRPNPQATIPIGGLTFKASR